MVLGHPQDIQNELVLHIHVDHLARSPLAHQLFHILFGSSIKSNFLIFMFFNFSLLFNS